MSVIFLPYSRLPMTLCRCACAGQGLDGAPSLDVMLLKQQAFTADELRMRPASVDGWSSAQLNHILTSCLVSDRRGNNLHSFHTVEFESDLYRGVMRARCYPFDMEEHRFRGKNIKVLRLRVHQCT